jgi:hypothetical protein
VSSSAATATKQFQKPISQLKTVQGKKNATAFDHKTNSDCQMPTTLVSQKIKPKTLSNVYGCINI